MKVKNLFFSLVVLTVIVISGWFIFTRPSLPALPDRPNTPTLPSGATDRAEASTFSQSIENLPDAQPSQTVVLKNGDTYNMTAMLVKKEVGNRRVKMLAYNGMIPGPVLKAPQGAEVTINFTNRTDVETTVHSHGVRLDAAYDGTPYISQKPVGIGETFTYKIKFPDAGIFWYHPHIREDYAQELGLYGNFLVQPGDPDFWSPVNREVALMLDDILLDENGIVPFSKTTSDHTLMGRFGDTMLVNGETDYRLNVSQGEVVRLYLTNAANTRTLNIRIPNAKMKLVGGDNGKYERETWVESVILGPSERVIVEVWFEKAGDYELQHTTPQRTYRLGTIHVDNSAIPYSYQKEFSTLRENRDVIQDIDQYRPYFDREPDKKLTMTITMGMMGSGMMGHGGHSMMGMNSGEPIEWEDGQDMMNSMSTSRMVKWKLVDDETKQENMQINWEFKQGDVAKIRIFNDPKSMHPMQHPIHFHGQRFLVISRDGKKSENLVWKDTVLIKTGETVDLLVEMSNPGKWMAHCHIAEHLESGMMLGFNVTSKTDTQAANPDPVQAKIYVALEGEGALALIDAQNKALIQKIDLSGKTANRMAHNVQVAPDQKSVWVTANAMGDHAAMTGMKNVDGKAAVADEVIVIDPKTDQILQHISIAPEQHLAHVVLTPDSRYAYVTAQNSGIMYKINAQNYTVEKKISAPAGSEPHGLRIAPDGKTGYIAMLKGKSLGVLDLQNDAFREVALEGAAVQTAVSPDGKYVFVSQYDTKSIAVYRPSTQAVTYIRLPEEAKGPVQLFVTPDSRYLYVADQGYYFDQPTSSKVYKIDIPSMQVIHTIAAGQAPHGVVVSGNGNFVYVTNLLSNDISVIDTTTDLEIKRIPVGQEPNGISVWSR